jgi:UDP-N-acetylmuramate dehydrogenase
MIAATGLEEAATMLRERLGAHVRRDVPLAPMTTYRVGGPAALFVDVGSTDELVAIAEVRAATGVPVLVVGRGSNMLVADEGFAGLAISVAGFAGTIEHPADTVGLPLGAAVVVNAGGGVALPVLARQTAAAGLTGFEWAVGVPGSIGGAVRMNAGGHGSDMAACLIDVDVIDLAGGGTRRTLPAHSIGLRFRASSLAPGHVVITARLGLQVGDRAAAEAEIAEVVRWRREHQPGGQNCGSVFVNPVPGEVAAGALIDGLGLRGLRIGTAWVSEKHANFIQAGEGGSAADVRAVMEAVRARVADATGYRLRSEVRLVGFDDADPMSFDEAQPAGKA